MGFFDFLKSYRKRSGARKKIPYGEKKIKTADNEGYNAGTESKGSFDEGTNRTIKKPPASIVHRGSKYTRWCALLYIPGNWWERRLRASLKKELQVKSMHKI